MKKFLLLSILPFLFAECALGVFVQSQKSVTFLSLLEEMSDERSLAEWPEGKGYKTLQASSYARDSTSRDTAAEDGKFRPAGGRDWGRGWFENHDFGQFIREEKTDGRTELVMMEDRGPGAIVRFWATYGGTPDTSGGIYRIYLDGETQPVISMFHKDLIGGTGLIGKPYSFLAPEEAENPTWRGRNLMLPIPYSTGCKVTYEPKSLGGWNGHYYAIIYRKYDPAVKVERFTANTIKENQAELKRYAEILTHKSSTTQGAISSQNGLLKAGQSFELQLDGKRAITALRCNIDAKDIEQALRSTVLEITFDDNKTVWCPVGQFFGIGYRKLRNETFYITTDSTGNMESRWLMPFEKTAIVKLHNYSDQPIDVSQFEVAHRDYQWGKNSMYFHAAWNETKGLKSDVKIDYNFITISGKGVFVGDNLTIYNSYPDKTGINWWGEGDEKIYVDGEAFPSHFGTGTEDYYCYAWCRPQWFSNICSSQPIGEGNKTPGLTVNNRYRLLDTIPFTRSFAFDMEIWHPYYAKMNYSPATFWYAFGGADWNYKENIEEVKKPVAKSMKDVTTAQAEKVKVFILSGQSNAVGYNHINAMSKTNRDNLMADIASISDDVFFWAGTNALHGYGGTWRAPNIGVSDISSGGYAKGCFGPEIGMSLALAEAFEGERIAIIKFAKGGRGIARSQDYTDYIPALAGYNDHGRNFYPSSEGKDAGILYKELIRNVKLALVKLEGQGVTYEICGFFWMQGEHESGISRKMAEDYDDLLTLFRSSVRRDLDVEDMPFIVGEINNHTWAFREIGLASQAKAVSQDDANSILVKTSDLERGGVGGASHFTSQATLDLGNRFIDGYTTLTTKGNQ